MGTRSAELIYSLVSLSDVVISGDGLTIAFHRSSPDKDTGEQRSNVAVVSLANDVEIHRTTGFKDRYPQFILDDRFLSFLRTDDDGLNHILKLDLASWTLFTIATITEPVHELSWSPNGRRVAIVSSVRNVPLTLDTSGVKVITRLKYKNDVLGWINESYRHISVIDADNGTVVQVTTGDYENYAVNWSPDSEKIAFISQRDKERDLVDFSGVYVIPVHGGEPVFYSEGLFTVSSLVWSPQGGRLAVVGSHRRLSGGTSIQGWIYIVSENDEPEILTGDMIKPMAGFPPQGPFTNLVWTSSDDIVFIGESRGRGFVCQLDLATNMRKVWGGDLKINAFSMDKRAKNIALIAGSVNVPGDIHILDRESESVRKITDYNSDYFRDRTISTEKFVVTRGGFDIESRIYFPPDFDPSVEYPLVLDIHGGPNGVFMDTFDPLHHLLSCSGYIVLAVNPRGSSTYGEDFGMAVLSDWGGEDYYDLMSALGQILEKPYVDPARMGVHGYSYGGYMASWMIGHAEIFKAAAIGAPCTDLLSMAGTSDIGVSWGEMQWGGRRDFVMEDISLRSPINHANNVQTPVLLLHGEEDLRCPISQSEEYFVALKRMGKTVEFIRFPRCSHRFIRIGGDARMAVQYFERVLAWFDHYVLGTQV